MGESGVEAFKIVRHSIMVEVVNHKAFTTGSSTLHLLSGLANGGVIVSIENEFSGSLLLRHQRTAKRPTSACCHVGFDAQLRTTVFYILEHAHPTRR